MGSCIVLVIVFVLFVAIAAYLYRVGIVKEGFVNITNTNEESIIRAYNSILHRDPSPDELMLALDDIREKRKTMHELGMELVNSDEYQRYTKTQTNSISPDLIRILAEDEYLKKVKKIYMDVFNKMIDHNLVLPYNDIYVHLFGRSDSRLISMFKDERYPGFEKDVLESQKLDLDRDKLFAFYEKTFSKDAPARKEGEPQPMYLVSENTLASDAGMWVPSDEDVGRTVQTPWRSASQEEATYKRFVPEGTQFVFSTPISLTEPIMPPFKSKQPVVVGRLPVPKPPLQDELVGAASLSTTPLTLPNKMPLDGLGI